MQDTGRLRNTLDQFYTIPAVASDCVALLRKHVTEGVWIEPSAGTGVFLDCVPGALGYDVMPKHPRVIQADFLETELPEHCVVFGNPPFGRQSSLARKFIRHAAVRSDWIAFILPRSFSKPSMQAAFPPIFHLVESRTLPKNSFVINDTPYDVPCVFQIWNRKNTPRCVEIPAVPSGFAFVKHTEPHDLVFRRVGVNAGQCSLPGSQSMQSHYFIKLEDSSRADHIVNVSRTTTFPTNTTGPRSLSRGEATTFLNSLTTG
jgi:hypothetical protein